MIELRRGTSLTDQQWAVVSEHLDRIERACLAQDWPLVVGSAKELVESVARFAVDHGGISVGNRVDLRGLVEAAHGVLERPDNEEFASDLPTARIIKQVKHAVCELAELRTLSGPAMARQRARRPWRSTPMWRWMRRSRGAAGPSDGLLR